MLDINLIIDHYEDVKNKLQSRGYSLELDELKELHDSRKEIITQKEKLAAKKCEIANTCPTLYMYLFY